MQKLPVSRLHELYTAIAAERQLYLPIAHKGRVNFAEWSDGERVRLDVLKTVKSAKDLFFPQIEDIACFQVEKKNLSILPAERSDQPFVLFGVRACDARSFELLDMVFLSPPVDSFYAARRKGGVVVTLSCAEPEETCFCTAFEDIDAAEPGGDVAAWIVGDTFYWKARTEKGKALIESVASLFEAADGEEIAESQARTRDILSRLPLGKLKVEEFTEGKLKEVFDSGQWKDLSKACIGCGTCTFVCPTCQCYDIRDFDTGNGIRRFRCWDSCMYSDFTLMAHGNPRKTQLERFRQRFMHKLVYFPENNDGVYSCVGCGRCVSKCPVSMNMVKVIKALGVDEDGK